MAGVRPLLLVYAREKLRKPIFARSARHSTPKSSVKLSAIQIALGQQRGQVTLRSADPYAAPVIQSNMLAAEEDMVALREGMRISRALGNSARMARHVSREILPGELTGKALDDLIRAGAMSMHHPTSTAAMGRDDLAVVDAQLRVRDVKRLRIADASVMPTITTGNTQAPTVIIGERLAEILRAG